MTVKKYFSASMVRLRGRVKSRPRVLLNVTVRVIYFKIKLLNYSFRNWLTVILKIWYKLLQIWRSSSTAELLGKDFFNLKLEWFPSWYSLRISFGLRYQVLSTICNHDMSDKILHQITKPRTCRQGKILTLSSNPGRA